MKSNRRIVSLMMSLLACCALMQAQSKKLISGIVIDVANKEPLPYVTISLKEALIGVVTNEEGKFDLYIPATVDKDTLFVNYLGYKHVLLDISELKSPLTIGLESTVVQLDEIVVKPLKPEDYIQMAMRKIKQNYPEQPFQTNAYYREKLNENGVLLNCEEGIFKTYCQSFLDTVKTQNQLMLFRTEKHSEKMVFLHRMRERRKERDSLERVKKKTAGMDSSAVAKGDTARADTSKMTINVGDSFGGPAGILKSGSIGIKPETFLDSLHFKSYKYNFAKSTTYNTDELMVIDFESKEKLDGLKQTGKIYINTANQAIVRIEWTGSMHLPGVLKSLLFVLGVRLRHPGFDKSMEFQEVNGRWYPKNIQMVIHFLLIDTHMFRKNDRSNFEIEQFLTVNDLNTVDPAQIPEAKRFNKEKKMDGQVYNDDGITWEGLNIIKPETVKQ